MTNGHKKDCKLGVDIGGTFTDVAVKIKDSLYTSKKLTVPNAPEESVLAGISEVLVQADISPSDVSLIIHGTTLATNAIIERKGAKTAFITTEGFRDVIEMRTESRFDQYDLKLNLPDPLVPRDSRFTIKERMSAKGEELIKLDENSLLHLTSVLADEKFESIAIGLLHSYTNPCHELRVRDILQNSLPHIPTSISSEVSPEIREYERFTTTCVNAYIQPLISPYLKNMQSRLNDMGINCPLFLMLSNGGLSDLETAIKYPIRIVESGPAGGAVLASKIAREYHLEKIVSFDMGGTTAKICLLDDAEPSTAREFEVAREYRFKPGSGIPLRIPVIEMVEVGAGGGSICGVDDLSMIFVGPKSAGSIPGPSCYGKGGKMPTVTDANLILGRLDPNCFADGQITLRPDAAKESMEKVICDEMQVSAEIGAMGVVEMVDENMANAAREHAIERGKSLNGRTIIAFGGSAPLHVARLAEKLGVKKIIVPAGASVGSAIGFLYAPIAFEITRSFYQRLSNIDMRAVFRLFDRIGKEARKIVKGATRRQNLNVQRSAYMRFVGQRHEIKVVLPSDLNDQSAIEVIRESFYEAYRSQYSRIMPNVDIESVGWSVSVTASNEIADKHTNTPKTKTIKSNETMRVWDFATGMAIDSFIFHRDNLTPGTKISGPAIISEPQTTTVIPVNFKAIIDGNGSIVIEAK